MTVTGSGSFDGQQGSLDVQLPALLGRSGGAAKLVYVTENGAPVIYVQLPFALPGGKSWVRLDLKQAGQAAGVDVSQLLSGAGQNPADALQLLQSSGEFSAVGKETVDGVETTHYHGTIDLEKAAKTAGASDVVQRLLDAGAPARFPLDVWIDGQGYIRQVAEHYDAGVGSLDLTLKLSDYGTPVNVSAPPADEVFDATSLAVQGIQAHKR